MHTDRVVRRDPKTGNVAQYLTPATFWVGSNHDRPRAVLDGLRA